MNNKSEILQELRSAMEFYSELGFNYLPVKEKELTGLLNVQENVSLPECGAVPAVTPVMAETLEGLRRETGDCRRCKLCNGRKNIVFGEGAPRADIMFIGEGPGIDDDIQARPFAGDDGTLLTNLIVKLGLKRDDVYITNIVKCSPPGSRTPEPDEIEACRPFVERQVEIIGPKVIVCLGQVAVNALLRNNAPISSLRGSFLEFRGIPVMPTFHPAYLLRNRKDKWLTWDDMQKVVERVK
jgi:DNA polymerase